MRSLKAAAAFVAIAMPAMPAPAPAQPVGESGFVLDIGLSPRAASELRRRNEGISVAISYIGDPRPEYEDEADVAGIDLGHEEQTVPGRAGEVVVPENILQRDRLSRISGPPRVHVNVYSARRSGPDNLLDCESFEAPVSDIGGSMQSVQCRLIGE